MNDVSPEIPLLPSIAPLASRYDVWLCDIWGVMHNGERVFEAAGEACRRFREAGGTVVLISNSPRLRQGVEQQMSMLDVPADAWDGLLTSGDVTRGLLEENQDKRLFHLGPARDKGIFEGLEINFASPEDGEMIICSGLYDDDTETPDNYADLLGRLAKQGLPMICANPDLMVERGNKLVYCAGALAAAYEKLGGQVIYTGKPHPPLYGLAFSLAEKLRGEAVARDRILGIGDGLKTDIAGAIAAGIDALFVASGLHLAQAGSDGSADATAISELFAETDMRPVGALARLVW